MPFLLIVFLMLACLPRVGEDWLQPPWIESSWLSALLTWSAVLFLVWLTVAKPWLGGYECAL